MGKKFRLYPTIDSIAVKTEIQKGLTIIRWKDKGSDENGNDKAEAVDVADDNNDDALMEAQNVQSKTVDFAMTRATYMMFNRRLYAPNAANDKLEFNLQQTREALEDIHQK